MAIIEAEKKYEALTTISLDEKQAEVIAAFDEIMALGHHQELAAILEEVITIGHHSEAIILEAEHKVFEKKMRKE